MTQPPPQSRRADDEAARWFARLSKPHVTNADLDAFYAWRRSPANAAAYARLEDIGVAASELAGDPQIDAAAIEILNRSARRAASRPALRAKALGAGAAALVVAAAAVSFFILDAGQVYRTEVGERRIVRLADGSMLQLNTDSEAKVALAKDQRRVQLRRGQLFVDVAPDPGRPFVVEAGDLQVKALGTRFDVRRDDRLAVVTLAEGKVAVRDKGRPHEQWVLAQGQQLAAAGKSRPLRADVEAVTSWTSGRLTFRDTPLAAAVAEVNRYSRDKIVLGDDVDGAAFVDGAFDAGDVRAFANAAADLFDLSLKVENDQIRLDRPSHQNPK